MPEPSVRQPRKYAELEAGSGDDLIQAEAAIRVFRKPPLGDLHPDKLKQERAANSEAGDEAELRPPEGRRSEAGGREPEKTRGSLAAAPRKQEAACK